MNPEVKHFFDPATCTFTYVVFDREGGTGVIIDPVLDFDASSGNVGYQSAQQVLDFIIGQQLTIEWILETHAHADHLTAAQFLKAKTGAKIAIGEGISEVQKTFKQVFNFCSDFAVDGSQFDHCFKIPKVGFRETGYNIYIINILLISRYAHKQYLSNGIVSAI